MLLLLLVLSILVLLALLWGGSLVAQSYFYNVPADHLAIRALIGSAAMAFFLTFWVWLDGRAPGKYSTLFDFAQYDIKEYPEFEAVRSFAKMEMVEGKMKTVPYGKEKLTTYRKRPGGKTTRDYLNTENEPYVRASTEWITTGVVIKEKSDNGEVTARRFEAEVDANGKYASDLRFIEKGGYGYMTEDGLGRVFTERPSTLFANLFLNGFHFVLWFAIFWPCLRYLPGHAMVFTLAFGLLVMLVILPILFSLNTR